MSPSTKEYRVGISGIFADTFKRETKIYLNLIIPLVITLATVVMLYIHEEADSYTVIITTSQLVLDVFPDIIGFSIAAYALIIGFQGTAIIQNAIKVGKDGHFRALIAIFAIYIMGQCLTLTVAIISMWLHNNKIIFENKISITCIPIINFMAVFFLILGIVFTLSLSIPLIIKIFNVGQLVNFFTKRTGQKTE